MNYLKPGEWPDRSKCIHSHVRGAMLDGVRWLVCARCNTPVSKIPDRPTDVAADTEATMRRVTEKSLRGS